MSLDASWDRGKPGLVPEALLRAAVAAVNGTRNHLHLEIDEDFNVYGGSATVDVEDLGPILLSQPDEPDATFGMQISTSIGGSRERWEELFEAADDLATALGLTYSDADEAPVKRGPPSALLGQQLDLTSVRVALSLRPRMPEVTPAVPSPRIVESVAIETEPLATFSGEELGAVTEATIEAVAWALHLSARATGLPALGDLASWATEYEVSEPDADGFFVEDGDDSLFVALDGDDNVELIGRPAIEVDLRRALELDYNELSVSALSIDADDTIMLRAVAPRAGLTPATFAAWLTDAFDDLRRVAEEGGGDEDGEHDDEDDDDEDEESADEDDDA